MPLRNPQIRSIPMTTGCAWQFPAKFAAAGDEFRLKRLLVFTDVATSLYIGEIKLVTDNTPIKVDTFAPQTVAVQDDVFLVANAEAGVSSLKYSWNYDASRGTQTETTAKVGHYIYTRGAKTPAGMTRLSWSRLQ